MKQNVGTADAILRITFGLVGIAYSIVCANRRRNHFPWIMTTLSAMKVAEGIIRYCPMLDLLGINSDQQKNEKSSFTASDIINEITHKS